MSKVDILNSLNVPSQKPLDYKLYFVTLAEVKDLGTNGINTYKYYEDMKAQCVETHKEYIWREKKNSEDIGIAEDFTYPAGLVSFGIDYGDRVFNFFPNDVVDNSSEGFEDGTTYIWIKYAEDANGLNMTDVITSTSTHIGIAVNKTSSIKSTDPLDYTWASINTSTGVPDGNGTYTWIKYSLKNDGTAPLVDNATNMKYIGIATQKVEQEESVDYTDYEWHLINNDIGLVNQNNLVTVIPIYVADVNNVTLQDIADWINTNGITVDEDELVTFDIQELVEVEPVYPILDTTIPITVTATVLNATDVTIDWVYANTLDNYLRFVVQITDIAQNTVIYNDNIEAGTFTKNYTGLGTDKEYTVQVLVVGNNVNGQPYSYVYSNVVTFNLYADNTTPSILVKDVTDSTIELSWNIDTAFNHDRFEVYQDAVLVYDTVDANDLSTVLTGLAANTSFDFYVIAYNGISASTQSATVTASTLASVSPPLGTPSIVYNHATEDTVKFEVVFPTIDVSRVTSFLVSYRINGLTVWKTRKVTDVSLVQFFDGLERDTTYELKLQTQDDEDILSADSNIITFVTLEDNDIKIIITPDLGTVSSADISIVNGTPYQKLHIRILANRFIISLDRYVWTAPSYLQQAVLNSQQLASIGSQIQFETKEITLDANGEYQDRYVLGVTYDNEANAEGFFTEDVGVAGTIYLYDYNKEGDTFLTSEVYRAPNNIFNS